MSLFLVAATDINYGEALGNMIVGFLVVFFALLFLSGVISLFKYLGKADKSSQKAPVKAAPAKAAAPAAPAKPASGEDDVTIAVILAAVAQHCGPNAKVTSIERAK